MDRLELYEYWSIRRLVNLKIESLKEERESFRDNITPFDHEIYVMISDDIEKYEKIVNKISKILEV